MDRKWLLLFKGNIFTLTGQVQRTLFEQYFSVIHDVEELFFLEESAAQLVAADVFLWAAGNKRCFGLLNEEQTIGKLRELTGMRACEQMEKLRLIGAPSRKHASDETVLLTGAWAQVSKRLHNRYRRRRIAFRAGAISFMAVSLVLGGFLFGMIVPASLATGSYTGASKSIPAPIPDSSRPVAEGPVKLDERKVTEQEAKHYSDFKMGVPAYLPPGYTFDEGTVWLREGQEKSDHTLLLYTIRDKHLLRVSYYKMHKNSAFSTGSFMPVTTKEVFIRGTKALFSASKSNFVRLDWMENDTVISVSGRELDEAELVKMAESLK
ncbi:MAG: hypothetical protein K0S39_1949 [Paenibacillus sp.]|jgi:hypothetical protein|nr:hypothetical protein [Paenibacillus sp.]